MSWSTCASSGPVRREDAGGRFFATGSPGRRSHQAAAREGGLFLHDDQLEVREVSRVDAVLAAASDEFYAEFGRLQVRKDNANANILAHARGVGGCVPCARAVANVKELVTEYLKDASCINLRKPSK